MTVLLVRPDGVPVPALSLLQQQPDGAWKIDGCYLMPFQGEWLYLLALARMPGTLTAR